MIIDTEKEISEQEKGPAPSQFHLPYEENDESYISSSISCPLEPKDIDDEIKKVIQKLTGSDSITNNFALAEWECTDEKPLNELKTPGFFTQAFPTVFVSGSCDFTDNSLVSIELDEWISHIYYQGDGRVSKHPSLKLFLFNLSQCKKALNNGNFLVSQQLADAHITLEELKEKSRNGDESIPRKITQMGANLVQSDPYWGKRKRELDAFLFFRRKESGDLPCYFHTNSMAELHWSPLKLLLAKYISTYSNDDTQSILDQLNTDTHFLRQTDLQNLHIVTRYFEARSINYYNTVAKELYQANDYWFRFEFTKARGQIHSHGIIFSELHAKKVEEALDLNGQSDDYEKAQNLYKWLQTDTLSTNNIFSPGFVSILLEAPLKKIMN